VPHSQHDPQGLPVAFVSPRCQGLNNVSSLSKGHLKGYISHEKQTVVLSNKDPFPPLGNRITVTG
jgi:hypothetical protein